MTDNYKDVVFSDGEGLVFSDLLDAQRFYGSRLFEQVISNSFGNPNSATGGQDLGSGLSTDTFQANSNIGWAWALNPGAATPRNGSGNDKIRLTPGTLLQMVSNTLTGSDTQVLAYTFSGAEEWTLGANGTANPRIDVLWMQLAQATTSSVSRDFQDASTGVVTTTTTAKVRQVTATLGVTQGAAAVSPSIPLTPAGAVPVAYAVIGNGWSSAIASSAGITYGLPQPAANLVVIWDARMPVKTRLVWASPSDVQIIGNWQQVTGTPHFGTGFEPTALGNQIRVQCPVGSGRLVGIIGDLWHGGSGAVITCKVGQGAYGSGSTASRAAFDNAQTISITTDGRFVVPLNSFSGTSMTHLAPQGPVIIPNTNTYLPIWADGSFAAARPFVDSAAAKGWILNQHTGGSMLEFSIVVTVATSGASVGRIGFYIAEGI